MCSYRKFHSLGLSKWLLEITIDFSQGADSATLEVGTILGVMDDHTPADDREPISQEQGAGHVSDSERCI